MTTATATGRLKPGAPVTCAVNARSNCGFVSKSSNAVLLTERFVLAGSNTKAVPGVWLVWVNERIDDSPVDAGRTGPSTVPFGLFSGTEKAVSSSGGISTSSRVWDTSMRKYTSSPLRSANAWWISTCGSGWLASFGESVRSGAVGQSPIWPSSTCVAAQARPLIVTAQAMTTMESNCGLRRTTTPATSNIVSASAPSSASEVAGTRIGISGSPIPTTLVLSVRSAAPSSGLCAPKVIRQVPSPFNPNACTGAPSSITSS